MNDFTNATITKLIVHIVGNKVKDEKLVLSNKLTQWTDDITHQYLKHFFFTSFNFDIGYQFAHEVDINLNEIYTYSSNIFNNHNNFVQQSINIAKHLYEVSSHPNIKKGELYVAYIKGCVIDDIETDAIGIFKSETKDFYLDVMSGNEGFNISCNRGINTNKLDKGCLIFNIGLNTSGKVFIVDANSNDALYWKKRFLNLEEVSDEYTNTAAMLKTCKQYVKEAYNAAPSDKVNVLNNSLRYFENNDSFNINDFSDSVFTQPTESFQFKAYLAKTKPEFKQEDSFGISPKAVKSVKKSIKNLIKLDSNIEIKINTQLKDVNRIIEKGYDKEKKMSFYKIYYTNED